MQATESRTGCAKDGHAGAGMFAKVANFVRTTWESSGCGDRARRGRPSPGLSQRERSCSAMALRLAKVLRPISGGDGDPSELASLVREWS